MPAREETRVQRAWAQRRTAIDAQDVLACSDGARPGHGAVEAVRARTCARPYGRSGSLGDADLPGCCDPRDHAGLVAMLRVRRDARAVRQRIRTWCKAGV